MKLKRHDIREAMKNKFVKIADSHKNVFTLEEVLYNVNEVVDELYWEHKRIKDQASSGKVGEMKEHNTKVANLAILVKQKLGTKQFTAEILNRLTDDTLETILLDIINQLDLDSKK